RPISGESLDMLGMQTVAECMADYPVGHHPTMPAVRRTVQALVGHPPPRRQYASLPVETVRIPPTMIIFRAHTRGWQVTLAGVAQSASADCLLTANQEVAEFSDPLQTMRALAAVYRREAPGLPRAKICFRNSAMQPAVIGN